MNVDLLKDNSSWITCFYIAVPVFVIVMTSVYVIKCRKNLRDRIAKFSHKQKLFDEENGEIPASKIPENEEICSPNLGRISKYLKKRSGAKKSDEESQNTYALQVESPDHKTYDHHQLICDAAENSHTAIVESLISSGLEVHSRRKGKLSAIELATRGENLNIVNLRLDVDNEDEDCERLMLLAACHRHSQLINRFMEYGLDINTESLGVFYQEPVDMGSLDFGSGGPDDTNRISGESDAPIRTGTTDLCVTDDFYLRDIKYGMVEPKGFSIRTALRAAVCAGNMDIVNRLLECGAGVNGAPSSLDGRTALQAAADAGHIHIVNRLLELGSDINAKPSTGSGRTALQAASGCGHLGIMRKLLESGANINAEQAYPDGRTALEAAAENGHLSVVNTLLAAGANRVEVAAHGSRGSTALRYAINGGHEEVAEALRSVGCVQHDSQGGSARRT